MKEIESIQWAFTSMSNSGFEALEEWMIKNIGDNSIFKCSCNMILFIYFGAGILFQIAILIMVTYTTVENRLSNLETWIFYSILPFVFAPLFILTYFIHQHHKFILEVDYGDTEETINAINEGIVDPEKLKLRQKKLNKYKFNNEESLN